MKFTRCLVALLFVAGLFMVMPGCGAPLRETTIQTLELSSKTKKDVNRDMYEIAVRGQMGLLKANLHEIMKKIDADAQVEPEEVDTLVNNFTQVMADLGWLKEQFAKAEGLDSDVWVYIESRKKWIEKAVEDLNEAVSERDVEEMKNTLRTIANRVQRIEQSTRANK